MGKKDIEIPIDKNIIEAPISEIMPENYLPYAVEVAKDRALPDVRDGFKPVHRRILYGAYKLKAFPDRPYYKSARIVGDILGKYHPHGDTSVYEAMVILAQDFTTRVPLIDGHGNWGSPDGDSAAAMRYTEARLTNAAMEMLKDIDKDVVDMVSNYSDTELEPKVLPARLPNLLVNGAFGIAVGLATNIPPHNLCEVIDAAIAYINNPEITTKELMNYIKGPDLPTGGIIIGKKSLLSAYETGQGKVTLRAKANIERLQNDRYAIVISEFPYRKNKAKILQNISDMTADKNHSKALESITDIRDESDRNGIRAVIEFKKSTDRDTVEKVLKYLYKKTELQSNISFNMVAIADGKPKTLSLKSILRYYIEHQKEVVTRKCNNELKLAKKRFHIVDGFIKAIDIIDEIIATIKTSKSKKDSEENITAKFGFTQIQAEAIVELMLYRLSSLEIKTLQKEYRTLEKQINALEKILGSEKELYKVVKKDLKEIKDKYGDSRRTEIIDDDEEAKILVEDILVDEDIVLTISNEGYIKRVSDKYYKRANPKVEDIEYREGDFNRYLICSNTKNILMIFTDCGNLYQMRCDNVPEMKWKEKGERLDTLIKGLDLEKENIINILAFSELYKDKYLIFFTDKGVIKKSSLDKFQTSYSKLLALKLKENEKLIDVHAENECITENYIKVRTKIGLEFTLEKPKMENADRNILGTQLFHISKQDAVTSISYLNEFNIKSFVVNVALNGDISVSNRRSYKMAGCYTNSLCTLLLFGDKGSVYSIPSCIIENIGDRKLNLRELIDEFSDEEKIINIFSIANFKDDNSLFFFSKEGYVKRTLLNDFQGDYYYTKGYKLKDDNDRLVSVKLQHNDVSKDILLITKKAMGIRFKTDSINSMGKFATGVTGISLKESDEVIFGEFIERKDIKDEIVFEKGSVYSIYLITKNKLQKNIQLNDIKLQNRAGIGKKLMSLDIDDYLLEVK